MQYRKAKLLLPVIVFFLIPHLLAYYTCRRKNAIIADLDVLAEKNEIKSNRIFTLVYFLWFDKFYRNIFYYRLGKLSFILKYLPQADSFYVPATLQLGSGVYHSHPFSTILNAKTIGNNFSFRQCTTIGNKKDGGKEVPQIGNNVTVGANVCIIGDITIGDNVTIGAGSVVVNSFPSNVVLAGNPARIVKKI